MSAEIVPFGKYAGQPIERLLSDVNYLDWVKGQPGLMRSLETRHPAFFNIIITGGPETEDTPDHNALQLRLFDRAFQLAFLEVAAGKSVEAINEELRRVAQQEQEESFLEVAEKCSSKLKWLSEQIVECLDKIGGQFTQWDYNTGRGLEYWRKRSSDSDKEYEVQIRETPR